MSRVWVAQIYQICLPLSVCDISPKVDDHDDSHEKFIHDEDIGDGDEDHNKNDGGGGDGNVSGASDGYDHGDHYDEMDDEDEDIVTQQICPGSDIYFPPKYRKIGTRKGNLLRKKI